MASGPIAFLAPRPLADFTHQLQIELIQFMRIYRATVPIQHDPSLRAEWQALGANLGTWRAAAHADLEGAPIEQIPGSVSTNRRV